MSDLNFENDSFLVNASKLGGCRLEAKIKVKPEVAEKVYRKAIRLVNKQISIPGFRKGKAPDATVISRYGSYVDQEWKELLVNEAYRGAMELTGIHPMNKNSVQKPIIGECSREEGAEITLIYEYPPEVPQIDFSEISLPEIKTEEISQERVDEVVEEVLKSKADWEDVTGRGIQQGDFVDITIDNLDEDPPKAIVKDRRFEVDEKRMALWLKNLLIGLNPGEVAEGTSTIDENAEPSVKSKFKPTKVRITVHSIKKILPPELSDELAKTVGADSKEDLLKKIRHNLEKEAQEKQKAQRAEALENRLLEKYSFDLPSTIVETEKRERVKLRIQSLKIENFSDEEIESMGKTIEEEAAKEVDAYLRLYFLNKQIVKQGNISLSNQELNDEVVRQITQNPESYGKDMDEQTSRDLVSRLASMLMQRKAKEYALSQIKVAQ